MSYPLYHLKRQMISGSSSLPDFSFLHWTNFNCNFDYLLRIGAICDSLWEWLSFGTRSYILLEVEIGWWMILRCTIFVRYCTSMVYLHNKIWHTNGLFNTFLIKSVRVIALGVWIWIHKYFALNAFMPIVNFSLYIYYRVLMFDVWLSNI